MPFFSHCPIHRLGLLSPTPLGSSYLVATRQLHCLASSRPSLPLSPADADAVLPALSTSIAG
eukprot:2159461-Pyramimonas_sp.AAC.1